MKKKIRIENSFFQSDKIIYLLYIFLLIITTIYSYSLVDLNLTLFNNPLWETFRNWVTQLGYFQREKSAIIYIGIIISLFLFNFFLAKTKFNPIKLAFLIGLIALFAYPFLSHDFFNYLFDAKIVTFYHQNPYMLRPLDFPDDPWLRFMHWTHRTYPYGPVFLIISLISSFFSFGKFLLSFLFFKLMFVLFYLLTTYYLQKLNKRWALMFATHPLIIIEGLISPHNDLIGVSLAVVGIYYLFKNQQILSRLFLILSAGIKYITLPLVILVRKKSRLNFLSLIGLFFVLIYVSLKLEVQPWYFLSLFVFIPFYEEFLLKMNLFFVGLLLSYYPYIRFGGWDESWKVTMKHQIIIFFLIINLVIFLIRKLVHRLNLNKNKEVS